MLDSIYHNYDDIRFTLKLHFGCEDLKVLSLCTEHCYGRH